MSSDTFENIKLIQVVIFFKKKGKSSQSQGDRQYLYKAITFKIGKVCYENRKQIIAQPFIRRTRIREQEVIQQEYFH